MTDAQIQMGQVVWWVNADTQQPVPFTLDNDLSLRVRQQDALNEVIELFLVQDIDTFTLNSNTNIWDTQISINTATPPVAWNVVCLKEWERFLQIDILSVVNDWGWNYTLNLDSPLDFAFTTAWNCAIQTKDLTINWSLASPQIFRITPSWLNKNVYWDITRIMFEIQDDTTMDSAKFWWIPKLANWIVLRKKDWIYKNIWNVKTNWDFKLRAFDLDYDDKAPAWVFWMYVRRTFNWHDKNWVVIRLSAENNDELQLIIQDDLTELSVFRVMVQGHVVI